jgi:gluconokinase
LTALQRILAVDIGTSAARALLFDEEASLISQVRQPYPTLFPQPGWNEQEPDTVVGAVVKVLQEAVASLEDARQLHGIVLSSQMYSILALNREGVPLSNSLTWADTRSSAEIAAKRQNLAQSGIVERTGCPLQAIYPLAKVLWLKANLELPQDAKFVSIKEYVVFRLTGQLLSDWSIASATGLLNIARYCWDEDALAVCELTPENLPQLVSPRHVIRDWHPDIARQIGIPNHLPLILGSGDAPLANIGAGAIHPSTLAVNLGTSGAARMLISSPQIDSEGRLWTYVADEEKWVLGGIIGGAGAVYDWLLRKHIFPEWNDSTEQLYAVADNLAGSVNAGADDLLFVPYLAGEQSPGWSSGSRGLIAGLSFHHEPRHTIRATLEGIAFSLFRVAQIVEDLWEGPTQKVYLTGGLTASKLLCQIISDIFGVPVVVPDSPESSARGAAVLGWLALGQADSYEPFFSAVGYQELLVPHEDMHRFYQKRFDAFCSLNDRLQLFVSNKGG